MGSKAGSSIGAFLMSLPVSAILLMAVFGIPRFSPGTAGESSWQNARQFFTSLAEGNDGALSNARPFASADPRLGDVDRLNHGEAPRWDDAHPQENAERVADWPFGARDDDRAAERDHFAPRPGADRSMDRSAAGAAPTITWREARRKLAERGIDRFHLEPGLQGDDFLFVCLFSPDGNARVTQRFEAEAAEPLAAVEQVLNQVDEWLARRYAGQLDGHSSPR